MTMYVNGFRVSKDWRTLGAKPWKVPGVDGISLIIVEDVAPLLLYAAREFHRRVQPLTPGWCWSFAYRDVRGFPVPSFHAAAVAVDFNAPLHVLGARTSRSYTRAQIATVHQILAELDGTVRWGGDYTRRVDSMHFEVIAKPDRAARVAHQFLTATNPRPAPHPVPAPAPHPAPHVALPEDPVKNLVIVGIDHNRKIVSEAAYVYCPFTGQMRRLVNKAELLREKAAGAVDWPVTMDVLTSLGGH